MTNEPKPSEALLLAVVLCVGYAEDDCFDLAQQPEWPMIATELGLPETVEENEDIRWFCEEALARIAKEKSA